MTNPYLFVGSQGVMEELPGLYFMRARYYSAEAAVFLSTDPVKKIGPGWKPEAYIYANGNPLSYIDPPGLWGFVSLFPGAALQLDLWLVDDWRGGDAALTHDLSRQGSRRWESFIGNLGEKENRKFWGDIGKQALDWTQHPFEAPLAAIHDAFEIALTPVELLLLPWRGWGGGKTQGGLAFELFRKNNIIGRGSDTSARISVAGLPNAAGRLLGHAGQAAQGVLRGIMNAPRFLASRAVDAFQYANLKNIAQSAVAKLPSAAVSLAATFAGDLAADAFGRVLPKSTPPVVREAAKIAVGTAVAFAVSGGNPAVAAGYAVVSVIFKPAVEVLANGGKALV